MTNMFTMDKSWMDLSDRRQPVYINGVNSFLDFAFAHSARGNSIRCPCYKCGNNNFHTREIVFVHLILNGIIKTYRWWSSHGEDYYISSTDGRDDGFREDDEVIIKHDDMHDLSHDLNTDFNGLKAIFQERDHEDPNEAARKFYDLLDDYEQELYPGCKEFSKFQFMTTLLALKSDYRWTDQSFTKLLKVLKRAIPCSEKLPNTFYEANNYVQELGMECKKMDVCLNDCILYSGKFADFESCPTRGMSRWESSKINNNAESNMLSRTSTSIGVNTKSSHVEILTNNSPLHATSARQYLLDWRTNSCTFHPRSTTARIPSLARPFTQQDCEPSSRHQTKESQTSISLHLDRGMVNENTHAYVESIVERVSIETEVDHTEFNLPNEPHVRGDLISSLRRHYNVWRFHLHADHYLKWNTDEQRRANCPKYIDPAQWNWIISYWGSDRFKREAPQENDELPIYVRLWEKTHKGKHNEWQDETTEELYKKLLKLHDTQIREKGEDKLTPEEAYTIVLGHRSGYILGLGRRPRPSERVCTNVQQLRTEIRAELEVKMTSKLQEMEDRITSQLQEMKSKILPLLKQKEPKDQADNTN
ncbi:hypothetical protein KSP39_PZI006218 [Platanthera zijinensis]|uniref:Transposase-associated domain-containing protein n=1 Tax=Platanthera zijinensis TaxID=2320716 RepID=A0AAP0BUT9_9ASPA